MSKIGTIFGFRPKGDASTDLKASLTAAEAALGEARAAEADLRARRGDLLLDGDGAAVAENERDLRSKRDEIERLEAIVSALPTRISTAAEAERAAGARRLRSAADEEAEAGAALVPLYEAKALELQRIKDKIDEHTQATRQMNAELVSGGFDKVALPLRRAWPHGTRQGFGDDLRIPGPRHLCDSADDLAREFDRGRNGAARATA